MTGARGCGISAAAEGETIPLEPDHDMRRSDRRRAQQQRFEEKQKRREEEAARSEAQPAGDDPADTGREHIGVHDGTPSACRDGDDLVP